MADIDFQPSKVERENVGKSTDSALGNAQNEINSARGTLPNTSKAEIASQTQEMTKGNNPILPAFDMSGFGDGKQSKDSGASSSSSRNDAGNDSNQSKDSGASSSSSRSDAGNDSKQSKDSGASSSTSPTNSDANSSGQGSSDGSTKPTSDVPTQTGSDQVIFTPPSSTGNVTSAGSQTSASP